MIFKRFLMAISIENALHRGVAAHKAGKLQEAEHHYRAILKSQPLHPDANHNLGVIAVSVAKAGAALPLFKTALESNPKTEQFWLSYIDALIKEKHFDTAKEILEQGKKQGVNTAKLNILYAKIPVSTKVNEPKLATQKERLLFSEKRKKLDKAKLKRNSKIGAPPEAEVNNIIQLYQNGQHGDAKKLALSITTIYPEYPFGWKILGAILSQTGMNAEALSAKNTVIELEPQDAEAHNNLGITLTELGRLEECQSSLRRAIALKPDYLEAYYNLGNTLQEQGRLRESEINYRQVITIKSELPEIYYNLGNVLKKLDQLKETEVSFKKALILKPDYK